MAIRTTWWSPWRVNKSITFFIFKMAARTTCWSLWRVHKSNKTVHIFKMAAINTCLKVSGGFRNPAGRQNHMVESLGVNNSINFVFYFSRWPPEPHGGVSGKSINQLNFYFFFQDGRQNHMARINNSLNFLLYFPRWSPEPRFGVSRESLNQTK